MSDDDALAHTATATPTVGEAAAVKAVAAKRQLGRYRLDGELGAGGMGVVHEAFDTELERRVALKLMLHTGNADARSRLLREARAMAKLSHPAVVTIFEVGTHEGRDYVAMELVDGSSLADWLRATKRTTNEIVDAFITAGRGLAAAHAEGIVHRDFKPHNVLRSNSGRIAVTDFGLARHLEVPDDEGKNRGEPIRMTTLTATGAWVGTPAYMAPEQWRSGTITAATDQFAFCIALWEALSGQRPFRGETTDELRAAIERGAAALDPSGIPRAYRAILRRGLDLDPAKRWPSMNALVGKLERARKRGLRNFAIGIAIGLVIFTTIFVIVQRGQTEPSIDPMIQRVQRVADGRVKVPQPAILATVRELLGGKAVKAVPTTTRGVPVGFKLFIRSPNTFVEAVGISSGDLLTAINGRPVRTSEDLLGVVADLGEQPTTLRLDLERRGQPHAIEVVARDD